MPFLSLTRDQPRRKMKSYAKGEKNVDVYFLKASPPKAISIFLIYSGLILGVKKNCVGCS